MGTVLAYGEDALTLWVLQERLPEFLEELEDEADEQILVLYRPSFGRGSNIGEFDAIVATKKAAYLVEAKWWKSGELKKRDKKIVLQKPQLARHEKLMWLRERWEKDGSWIDFHEKYAGEFEEKFSAGDNKSTLAQPESQLAASLDYVMNEMAQRAPDQTQNVLLYISEGQEEGEAPTVVDPYDKKVDFSLVQIASPVREKADYFDLGVSLRV